MVALAVLCALTGATLGLRFAVMVLVPVTILVVALVMASKFVVGIDLWSTAIDAVVATTSLQLGYLSGAGIRLFLAAARSVAAPQPAAPSVTRPIFKIVPPHSD